MMHQYLTDALRDNVTFYVLDMLGPEERQAVAEHLQTGCPPCIKELQNVERVVGLLGFNTPAVRPPSEVRLRLLAGLTPATSTGQPPSGLESGFFCCRASEGHWQELSPGVSMKTLFTDPTTKRRTALVRMAPGTQLPRHQHLAVEELFVLAGDCHVAAGHVLLAGDYFRAEAGSVHETTFTEAGTTFLTLYWNTFPV
jgi:quercetin dioxygenase-like cupin family protein